MASIDLNVISDAGEYPPVHKWNPDFCGNMDLVIKRSGEWIHEGSPIKREKLVTLFSRILWKEGDEYFLVTPHEKVRIQVEDAPFLVTQCEQLINDQGQTYFSMQTSTNDRLSLGVDTDLELHEYEGELMPYIGMRYGMCASLHRNVFYDLASHYAAEEVCDGVTSWWIESAGKRYCLGRS